MIIEEDVKALSEILRATKVEFYTEKREVCLAQLLNISDSLNLARVALEWVEGRNNPWKPVAQFLKRAGAPVIKKEEPK